MDLPDICPHCGEYLLPETTAIRNEQTGKVAGFGCLCTKVFGVGNESEAEILDRYIHTISW